MSPSKTSGQYHEQKGGIKKAVSPPRGILLASERLTDPFYRLATRLGAVAPITAVRPSATRARESTTLHAPRATRRAPATVSLARRTPSSAPRRVTSQQHSGELNL